MRTEFVETLIEMAETDPRVFLVTADLGWSVLEKFAQRYPDRFLNVGVAEQNMAGIATGLAQLGYTPFIYSIATFTSMRCYEQVRNGAVLHHLPVRVVGIGGGYAYGHAGPTHHALEDLAIARAQPGLTVLVPADRDQAKAILRSTAELPGPAYLRIAKDQREAIPGLNGRFALNCPEVVREGADVLLLAVGDIAHEAVKAARQLEIQGVSAAVAVLAHLGFSGSPELVELLARFPRVATVEEGYTAGGLASLAGETIAVNGLSCRLIALGVRTSFPDVSGSTQFLRGLAGITAEQIVRSVGETSRQKRRAA